jgi:hypothetical protein
MNNLPWMLSCGSYNSIPRKLNFPRSIPLKTETILSAPIIGRISMMADGRFTVEGEEHAENYFSWRNIRHWLVVRGLRREFGFDDGA